MDPDQPTGQTRPEEAQAPGAAELARLIREHREEIVDRWVQANRGERRSWALSEEQLRDRIPLVVDQLADLTAHPAARAAGPAPGNPADIHALDRLDEGFDLEDLMDEYRLLRRCTVETLAERVPALSIPAVVAVGEAIDQAVARSVARFQATRQRALEALDQLSEAGMGAQSLGDLLNGLLGVLAATVPSVDAASIFLREGDRLTVRAAAGLTQEQGPFSLAMGEGFAGTVAATRKPLLVRSAATDPLVKNERLRRSGVRALYGVPMLDADGEVVGVANMGSLTAYDFSGEDKLLLRTITHRAAGVIAQHLLREAAEKRAVRLRHAETLFSAHPDFFYLIDRQHRMTWVSPALLRLWGRTLDEAVGRTFEELDYPGHLVALHREQVDQVLQGESVRGVNPYTNSKGETGIYEYLLVPVRGPDGAVEAAAGVTRDVSERFRAEQARADALVRERSSREEAEQTVSVLESLLAGSPAGIAFMDANLRYLRINEALAAVNGQPAKAHVGRSVREVIPIAAEHLEPLLRRVVETGEAAVNVEFEAPPPSTPERVRAFLGTYFPVRAHGAIAGVGAVVVEITDRKKMEEELRAAVQVRERLMGILGHDLRNPLAVVIAGTSALMRSPALGERERATVARITRNAERMARMIRDLLDYARASGGGLPIERKPADLGQIARQVIDDMRPSYPGREIRLQVDQGDTRGEWDPDRLAQLLLNLVSNALQYSPADTPVEVRVIAQCPLTVRLEVHNAGEPIPEKMLPALFEPFRRSAASDSASPGGLGLGLFIVRQIARGHGGSAEVASNAVEGTTFSVTLPRR